MSSEKEAINASSVCRIERRSDALVAILRGALWAPDTSWRRAQHGGETLFWRELTAAEAYRFIRHQEPPSAISCAAVEVDDSVVSLKAMPSVLVPAVLADHQGESFVIRVGFQHASKKSTVDLHPSADVDPSRGYTISECTWVAFDPDAYREITFSLQNEGLHLKNGEAVVTFRQYHILRRAWREEGVPVIESVPDSEVVSQLRASLDTATAQVPSTLAIELYPYQREGLKWLQFCHRFRLGCLLGDDMGLGKTITAIALMASTVRNGSPHLVVCPTTILEHWLREISRSCEVLRVALHHGSERLLTVEDLLAYDVVVTSYGTLRSDIGLLSGVNWNAIILDEAQKIKNPETGVSEACRRLRGLCSVAMTGTPFENRPLDLWSLMDFVEPGLLGSRRQFEAAHADTELPGRNTAIQNLEETVSLFMLRRLKSDVRSDLPEKIEMDQPVAMTASEATEYRRLVGELKDQARVKGTSANLLTPLRMMCCHPRLKDAALREDPVHACSKYRRLISLLKQVIESGEKAIIFTSFLGMLDILETDLPSRLGVPAFRIDGGVPAKERQPTVDAFSDIAGSAVLLLNPLAAGLGLNIVAANHVIHYNREWNPAVEDQATDRAYRIGQDRTVMVHYMFYVETVDEIISNRLSAKRDMAGKLVLPSGDKEADREAILSALEVVPTHMIEDLADEEADEATIT